MSYTERLRFVRGVARGLAYLHGLSPPIAHGNIKPENVLITNDKVPALCDIGFARIRDGILQREKYSVETPVATGRYHAKELLNGNPPTDMSDAYALGGIILFAMTGKEPFYHLRVKAAVVIAIFLEETPDPKFYSALPSDDDLWGLMRKCWDPNPGQRSSVSQVIFKINLIIEVGSGLTDQSAILQPDGNAPVVPVWPAEESIIQPGIKVSTVHPPLSGVLERVRYAGAGRCGNVHQGCWTVPGKDPIVVAMKGIRSNVKSQVMDGYTPDLFVKRESVIWKAAEHPHILPFYGYWFVDEKPLLISQWCEKGNLSSYLGEHPELTEVQKLSVVRDIARGLAYLHSLEPPIAHGGIRPQNVLIAGDSRAVICDIGHSLVTQSLETRTGLTMDPYSAKEIILGESSPTAMSDVYALGGLILVVMTRKAPFYYLPTWAAVTIAIFQDLNPNQKYYPTIPPDHVLWRWMIKCWNSDPSLRPTVAQIIYKINLIIDFGSGLTGPVDGDSSVKAPPLSNESILHPGVTLPTLTPPLPGILTIGEYVGEGGYGDVHRGIWTPPGRDPVSVAIKCIRNIRERGITDEQMHALFLRRIKRETSIWKASEHPNVLPFHGYQIVDGTPMFVSPWYENGNLCSYLGKHPELTDVQKLKLLRGAARGLVHLHCIEPPICHGDIKPQNVIINDELEAILCDFGISRVMNCEGGTGMTTLGTATGTHGYQAKELFQPKPRPNDMSDTYAFGGLILAGIWISQDSPKTMTGNPPFYKSLSNPNYIVVLVFTDVTPDPNDHPGLTPTDPLWDLMKRCWDPKPDHRPPMAQVLIELESEIECRSKRGEAKAAVSFCVSS
ncbi:hypothetical protein FS837_007337 [Tulasnella sp. UAMH 9824]|nr:hypothetical protein FS837_007337 [Tulasnella sp. UAMH 9824]